MRGHYTFLYSFCLDARTCLRFSVHLDDQCRYQNDSSLTPPSWALLDHHQCPPCTFSPKDTQYCPIGVNISQLVEYFREVHSHTPCTVTCVSRERTVSKETVVQEGLASILGLLMATSGCPIMDFFRPLARFHLPFASVDESIFRVTATYLLSRYYRQHANGVIELAEMKAHYRLVQQVNRAILSRIRDIAAGDADTNAIVTLDSLGQILELEVDTNLESLRSLFTPHKQD